MNDKLISCFIKSSCSHKTGNVWPMSKLRLSVRSQNSHIFHERYPFFCLFLSCQILKCHGKHVLMVITMHSSKKTIVPHIFMWIKVDEPILLLEFKGSPQLLHLMQLQFLRGHLIEFVCVPKNWIGLSNPLSFFDIIYQAMEAQRFH